jgi:hypothetical protein
MCTVAETPGAESACATNHPLAHAEHGDELPAPRTCRHCHCTDEQGCACGCCWVAPDLCSCCAVVIEELVSLLDDYSMCSAAAENNTRFTAAFNGCLRDAVAIFTGESLLEPLIAAPSPEDGRRAMRSEAEVRRAIAHMQEVASDLEGSYRNRYLPDIARQIDLLRWVLGDASHFSDLMRAMDDVDAGCAPGGRQ